MESWGFHINFAQWSKLFLSSSKAHRETFTSIEILFESFHIPEIKSIVAYKFSNFIADCGGLLGLFLGCSVLSIVELCYLLVLFICKRKDKNLKVHQKKIKKKFQEIHKSNREIFIINEFKKRDVTNPWKYWAICLSLALEMHTLTAIFNRTAYHAIDSSIKRLSGLNKVKFSLVALSLISVRLIAVC
jgi:hypothetical protein